MIFIHLGLNSFHNFLSFRESNSDQISIIFDMTNTGWNNMDMVKYFNITDRLR